MQFEGRRRVSRVPNLTPLIDVVFLLLIFFMLTSHFVRDESIPLNLPTADSAGPLEEQTLQVVLDGQGHILLDGAQIDPQALEERLRLALGNRGDRRLQIRGDRVASLGLTVNVLDAARKAGAEGVDIVTREP
ncbi:MAG: biopolymer transporter ExbD [Thermodesulfobacteriota bacterium]